MDGDIVGEFATLSEVEQAMNEYVQDHASEICGDNREWVIDMIDIAPIERHENKWK